MRRRKSSRLLSPLLSAMLLAAGRARILDFGGNLGLVYFDVSNLADTCIDLFHCPGLFRANYTQLEMVAHQFHCLFKDLLLFLHR